MDSFSRKIIDYKDDIISIASIYALDLWKCPLFVPVYDLIICSVINVHFSSSYKQWTPSLSLDDDDDDDDDTIR